MPPNRLARSDLGPESTFKMVKKERLQFEYGKYADNEVSDTGGSIIIIGIDFGTTFSGVAYTWSAKGDKVQVITSWDTDNYSGSNEEKTLTALSFVDQGQVNWGYSVRKDDGQVKWFKLLLLDEEDLPDDVRVSSRILEAREYLRRHNKTAIEVIAVYLRCLWNHSIQRITESVSKALVNYSKFHVVMTLPAIWPDYARSRMREAAYLAGILDARAAGETELTFVSEPEAGAIATFADMEGRQVRPFSVQSTQITIANMCIGYQCLYSDSSLPMV